MTKITKEQLIEKLQHRIAVAANYPDVEEAQLDATIFKIALDSIQQEPIGAFHIANQQVEGTSDYIKDGEWPIDDGVIEVYAAPQPLTNTEREELEAVKAQLKAAQAHITELEMAPPAPVEPGEEPVPVMPDFPGRVMTQRECWQAGKAFGLAEAGNSPVIPDGWVKCSERMPEWSDDVLCATEFDGPGDWRKKVGYWHDSKWVIYGASWTPTHWMPLPAVPKQENI